ncbi:MAG: redox-sensitive transcriptional activator SoxR [Devosiaceae bacterium]|nr:redox-sensitive transcriptional activator SoxR [Devosiaceae bacterium]
MGVSRGLSIGQLAARTGLSISAIRYYETQELVYPDRNAGGQRRYEASDIRRLSFVMIAQQVDFTIAQIQVQLKNLPDQRTPTKADWTKISKGFAYVLDKKIDTLTRLRNNLDGCIGCGCLSLEKCKLYNPNDRAGKNGPGPRFLMGDQIE